MQKTVHQNRSSPNTQY